MQAVGNITGEAVRSSHVRLLVSSRTLSTDTSCLAESAGPSSNGTGLTAILVGKQREQSSRAHIALSVQKARVAVGNITEDTLTVSSIGLEAGLALLAGSSSRAVNTVGNITGEAVRSSDVGLFVSSSTLSTNSVSLAESTGSSSNWASLTGVLIREKGEESS